jgi:hypothetical protein
MGGCLKGERGGEGELEEVLTAGGGRRQQSNFGGRRPTVKARRRPVLTVDLWRRAMGEGSPKAARRRAAPRGRGSIRWRSDVAQ